MPSEISKLANPIRNYDWGSRTFIAQLQDRPTPSAMPEAELWIGAHPRAPSRLGGPDGPPLDDCIAREPESLLGRRCMSKFGPALPFLVKVLAAAHPLSIQVHPNSAQAASGFEAENARGLALHAPDRSYADPKRKIELMVALEPVTALCGFRQPVEALALLEGVRHPVVDALLETSGKPVMDLSARVFSAARSLTEPERTMLSCALKGFALSGRAPDPESRWVERLTHEYPGDPGALAPLLMNLVSLAAGEALLVQPGTPHSYLDGSGVEVMSSSDNVVRGGLTPKHVDERELDRLVQTRPTAASTFRPILESTGVARYGLPDDVEEFSVRVLSPGDLSNGISRETKHAPTILLCVKGRVRISSAPDTTAPEPVDLQAGEAAWVPASVASYRATAIRRARAHPIAATLYEVSLG